MRTRVSWRYLIAAGIFGMLLVVVIYVSGKVADVTTEQASAKGPASSAAPVSSPAIVSARLTAKAVSDRLAVLYPLPNVRDNTGYAKDAGVVEAITSDAVTVLRFADDAKAQAWVDSFSQAGAADVRRAGVFVLSWAKRSEQDSTSADARAAMFGELQRLVSGA